MLIIKFWGQLDRVPVLYKTQNMFKGGGLQCLIDGLEICEKLANAKQYVLFSTKCFNMSDIASDTLIWLLLDIEDYFDDKKNKT